MTTKIFYRMDGEKIRFNTDVPEIGSLYRSNGALPYKPSYAYIKNGEYTQKIAGLEYTFKIINNAVFITQHSLFVGDLLIVNAPHKFTKTKKETFCKAVIHSMVNDQDCFFEQLDRVMDKQKEAQEIPAIIPDDLVLPDTISAYTPEAITGYPAIVDEIEDSIYLLSLNDEIERENLRSDLHEELYDMGSEYDSISLENEYNNGEEIELYNLLNPVVIVQKYNVPHLRLSIIEERVPA